MKYKPKKDLVRETGVARLRLTDAEREALESEIELAEYQQRHEAATLRGLLERLK